MNSLQFSAVGPKTFVINHFVFILRHQQNDNTYYKMTENKQRWLKSCKCLYLLFEFAIDIGTFGHLAIARIALF